MITAAKFWDKAATKYAKATIADEAAYQLTLGRTRSYLGADDHILEVGCGTGSTALLLAGDVAHITATDISGNMIAIANEKAQAQGVKNITFVTADIPDSPRRDGGYDAVLAHNLLHLLPDAPEAVAHIASFLKPGGIFVSKTVCSFGKGTPLKYRIMKAVLPLLQWLGKAPYVKFRHETELEAMITSAGFDLVESAFHPKTALSRYIVARKL